MYMTSRKDLTSAVMFWLPMLLLLVLFAFVLYPSIVSTSISVLMICFMVWLWFGTGYKIKGERIKITSGPFRSRINISDIKKIGRSKASFATISYLSGPALATDRLVVMYGEKSDVITISPKNEKEFVKTLIDINSAIQVDLTD